MRYSATAVLAAAMAMTMATEPHIAAGAPVEAQITDQIGALRASAEALQEAGFGSQGRKLAKGADEIAQWAGSHESLTTGQIDQLKKVAKQLTSAAKMWGGAGRQDKVDVLRQHAEVVGKAIAVMEPLARDDPGAAAGSGGTLTVLIRPGAGQSPGTGRTTRQRRQGPRTPPRDQGFNPADYGPMGQAAVQQGYIAAPAQGPTAGPAPYGPAYGTPARPTGGTTGGASGGVTVVLQEPKQTFDDVAKLGVYLRSQQKQFKTATIEFRIDGQVVWSDVQRVVNTFHAAPLAGPMRIVDLKLRHAPRGAIAQTPPGPLPVALPAARTPAAVPAEPATPSTPPVQSKESVEVIGNRMDPVLEGKKGVLFALDVTAGALPDALSSVMARIGQMPPSTSVAVIAMDPQNQPVKALDWMPAGPSAATELAMELAAAGAPASTPNFQALTQAAQAEYAKCQAIIFVVEGVRLPDEPLVLSAVYRLSQSPMPTGMVVMGQTGTEMRGVVETVGNRPGNAAAFVTR